MTVDVFLLAAGLGTRLRPLTETIPKPLVEVCGKPLIVRHLERLSAEGFRRVMINLHYLPDQIRSYVGDGSRWGLEVEYSFEPVLLDTGGGIKNAELWYQAREILVINSDSLFDSTLSLGKVVEAHRQASATLTLVVSPGLVSPGRREFTPLWVNKESDLVGFAKPPVVLEKQFQEEYSEVSYLGVMVFSKTLLSLMPERGKPFSLTSGIIPKLLADGQRVHTLPFAGYWNDIGTPERLLAASNFFKK